MFIVPSHLSVFPHHHHHYQQSTIMIIVTTHDGSQTKERFDQSQPCFRVSRGEVPHYLLGSRFTNSEL